MTDTTMRRRLENAELEYEPYVTLLAHCDSTCDPGNCEVEHNDENIELEWAPYVRLAQCPAHGLEAVTGHRIIPTGPGDLCDVGTFACGALVAEDVF